MTPTVQRGLDAALSDADLAREAARRQRAKALGLPLDSHIETIEEAEREEATDRAIDAKLGVKVCVGRRGNVRDNGETAAALLEKCIEVAGDRLMATCGFTVIRLSQPRASKQTPGIPDRFYLNPTRRLFVFWEAKKQGGKQSKAQKEFQALCAACGIAYVVGTTEPLRQWLTNQLEK